MLLLAFVGCGEQERVEYTSPESLGSATVAVAIGSAHDKFMSDNYPTANILRPDAMAELATMVSEGRADFAILDRNVAESMIALNENLVIVDPEVMHSNIAAGFNMENTQLRDEFNTFIDKFSKSEEFADIIEGWHSGEGHKANIQIPTEGPLLRAGVCSLSPPFCMVRDNELQGSSIDIVKHFAKEFGYLLELKPMNFPALLTSIQSGKIDILISGLTYTEERAKSINYSHFYQQNPSVVIARKDSSAVDEDEDEEYYTFEKFRTSRIGVLMGSTADAYVKEFCPDATIVNIEASSDFYPMAKGNKIDYFISDMPRVFKYQESMKDLKVGDPCLYSNGVAAAFHPDNAFLRSEFNDFLAKFGESDIYKDMLERWFIKGDTENIPTIESLDEGKKLFVATDCESFPYTAIINNKIEGFEIELVRRFALDRGYRVEFMPMKFSAVISAIASKKADMGASSICITDEREKIFLFSDAYYAVDSGVAYVDHNVTQYVDYRYPTTIESAKEGEKPNVDDTMRCFVGKGRVAVVEGSIQEQYATSILPASQVAITKDYSDALLTLISGKSEYLLTNLGTARNFEAAQESIEIILQDIFPYDTCIGINKDSRELKAELNAFLAEHEADGSLKALYNKWLTELSDATMEDYQYDPNGRVIKVGSSCTAMPFNFIANGRPMGLDIEVLALFCKERGYQLEVVEMPFGALVSSITTKKVDLIANTLSPTAERRTKIDFSLPYGYNCFALLYNREAVGADRDGGDGVFASIKEAFVRNIITEDRYKLIIDGIWVTLIISILSIIFGTIVGAWICSLTMSQSAILRWIGNLYVTIIRGTPVLVILMINFYVIFAQLPISPVWVATISFAMNFGAYVSEMFRSSIISIDKGQNEAGLAMGFSKIQTFIFIVAPQAISRVLPVYKGEAISLVKMTSIVGYIAVQDITKVGDIIRSRTFDAFFPLLVSALIYFVIAYIFTLVLDLLTAKYTRRK